MSIPITRKIQLSRVSGIDTPILKKDLEPGIEAEANKNGTIFVDKSVNIDSSHGKKVIKHEQVHIDQMERGDLDYDDNNVYWKGKTIPRSKINEGSKNLPWEKEAYNKSK